jgi:hypothetical protein
LLEFLVAGGQNHSALNDSGCSKAAVLGGFGSMQNTSLGCGSYLPTILRTFKKHSKCISVIHFLNLQISHPNNRKPCFC